MNLTNSIVGANGDEDPPVPIPNTEVKLISVENTWRVTAWKDRAVPTQSVIHFESRFFLCFKIRLEKMSEIESAAQRFLAFP